MISEDHVTEHLSNDVDDSALHHRNKLQFKIYANIKVIWNSVRSIGTNINFL